MKFIDLSIPIINSDELIFDPPGMELKITYNNHNTGARQMGAAFNLKPKEHLPNGKGWATERIT